MTNNKIVYENKNIGITVEETEDKNYIVKWEKKEMCPTEDKTLAIIFAKGFERGLAEGQKA